MKTMKTGILTFHRVYNYGAVLQAYSTQKILDELEIDNEIIGKYHVSWKMLLKINIVVA